MRLELIRKHGNEYHLPDNYLYKMNARIVSIDIDGTKISSSNYKMIGPRTIKMLNNNDNSSRVYATILPVQIGNILAVKYKKR
jgi:hypothetical protein